MSRSASSQIQKSHQQESTLPASVQFNTVMSLSGDIQATVGRKSHGSQLIKQTYNVVKQPLIYKSHLGTQQNSKPLFHCLQLQFTVFYTLTQWILVVNPNIVELGEISALGQQVKFKFHSCYSPNKTISPVFLLNGRMHFVLALLSAKSIICRLVTACKESE